MIAYLMKLRGWTLTESHAWVKDRHPTCNLNPGIGLPLHLWPARIFASLIWSSCELGNQKAADAMAVTLLALSVNTWRRYTRG